MYCSSCAFCKSLFTIQSASLSAKCNHVRIVYCLLLREKVNALRWMWLVPTHPLERCFLFVLVPISRWASSKRPVAHRKGEKNKANYSTFGIRLWVALSFACLLTAQVFNLPYTIRKQIMSWQSGWVAKYGASFFATFAALFLPFERDISRNPGSWI